VPPICSECSAPLRAHAPRRVRLTCGPTCRRRRSRRLRTETLRALFETQRLAALTGDTASLDRIARRATQLLGDKPE
jgi:hypothetical protein